MAASLRTAEKLLAVLASGSERSQVKALTRLDRLVQEGLQPPVSDYLMVGAAELEGDDFNSMQGRVVQMLWDAVVTPKCVAATYPQLGVEGRASAIRLLAEAQTSEATQVLEQVLHESLVAGTLPPDDFPLLSPLEPRYADAKQLIPVLLRILASGTWDGTVGQVLLDLAESDPLDAAQAEQAHVVVAGRIRAITSQLVEAEPASDEDDDRPYRVGLLVDALSRIDADTSVDLFRYLTGSANSWVRLWGAIGLIRADAPVDEQILNELASNPYCRNPLFDTLGENGRLDLFPAPFGQQEALAEGDLVRWLAYPTELGQPPDEIELLGAFPVELDDDAADYYLFKFRTFEPHEAASDGWMVGGAGPFLRAEQPTTSGMGSTFSMFTKADEMSPEEHAAALLDLISGYWRSRAEEF